MTKLFKMKIKSFLYRKNKVIHDYTQAFNQKLSHVLYVSIKLGIQKFIYSCSCIHLKVFEKIILNILIFSSNFICLILMPRISYHGK